MPAQLRIGYFGLPLGALLLGQDGHSIEWAVLSPLPQPGRRRLAKRLPPERLLDLMADESQSLGVGSAWQRHVDELITLRPIDLIVSWYFTRKLEARWLHLVPKGAIGAHPSLLPRHRGPDPFYAVIDQGDRETGVSIHYLTEEYDRGAVLAQRVIDVGERNAWQLARALDRPSLAGLREVTTAFAEGRPPRATEQNERLATEAPAPRGSGLRVDFTWPTARVLRRIRALGPVPGVALELFGLKLLVCAARPSDDYPRALLPGEAFLGDRLVLRTGDGAVAVERAAVELQEDPACEAERGPVTAGEPSCDPELDEEPATYSGADLLELLRAAREKLTDN